MAKQTGSPAPTAGAGPNVIGTPTLSMLDERLTISPSKPVRRPTISGAVNTTAGSMLKSTETTTMLGMPPPLSLVSVAKRRVLGHVQPGAAKAPSKLARSTTAPAVTSAVQDSPRQFYDHPPLDYDRAIANSSPVSASYSWKLAGQDDDPVYATMRLIGSSPSLSVPDQRSWAQTAKAQNQLQAQQPTPAPRREPVFLRDMPQRKALRSLQNLWRRPTEVAPSAAAAKHSKSAAAIEV